MPLSHAATLPPRPLYANQQCTIETLPRRLSTPIPDCLECVGNMSDRRGEKSGGEPCRVNRRLKVNIRSSGRSGYLRWIMVFADGLPCPRCVAPSVTV